VVNPSTLTISTVLRYIRHDSILALYTLREDFGEVIEAEVNASSRLVGQPTGSMDLPRGMKIGAIIRDDAVTFSSANVSIEQGDKVVALVTYSALRLAEALLGTKKTRFR
jgi:trk system potassium uptake protein TrkA